MALTSVQVQKLKEGQTLKYVDKSEKGDFDIEAKVVVLGIGLSGCSVEVTEVVSKGTSNMTCDGDQMAVTFAELEVLTKRATAKRPTKGKI